jgi:hypothetical protein
MKVVLSSWNNHANKAFGVPLIDQYMKVVLSSWNTMINQALGVPSIGQ